MTAGHADRGQYEKCRVVQAIGRKAIIEYAPMQPGDVTATCADIDDSRRDPGVQPATPLEDRIGQFVTWPRGFHAADAG